MITLYKFLGETPLQALDRLRLERPELEHETLSYAGRLDPMAEGLMLVLVGEENKERKKYLDLDKEYEVGILFGISTDTYDLLGKITQVSSMHLKKDVKDTKENTGKGVREPQIEKLLKKYEKTFEQEYPAYSSKIISNPELKNRTPTKKVTIYSVKLLNSRYLTVEEACKNAVAKIKNVRGNFRQDEIMKTWEDLEKSEYRGKKLLLITVYVACSSGTYMRSLADALGHELGTGALAYSIVRTKVGSVPSLS